MLASVRSKNIIDYGLILGLLFIPPVILIFLGSLYFPINFPLISWEGSQILADPNSLSNFYAPGSNPYAILAIVSRYRFFSKWLCKNITRILGLRQTNHQGYFLYFVWSLLSSLQILPFVLRIFTTINLMFFPFSISIHEIFLYNDRRYHWSWAFSKRIW